MKFLKKLWVIQRINIEASGGEWMRGEVISFHPHKHKHIVISADYEWMRIARNRWFIRWLMKLGLL